MFLLLQVLPLLGRDSVWVGIWGDPGGKFLWDLIVAEENSGNIQSLKLEDNEFQHFFTSKASKVYTRPTRPLKRSSSITSIVTRTYFLENKLLLISINFTPKTSHSCLKRWHTRFSRLFFGLTSFTDPSWYVHKIPFHRETSYEVGVSPF